MLLALLLAACGGGGAEAPTKPPLARVAFYGDSIMAGAIVVPYKDSGELISSWLPVRPVERIASIAGVEAVDYTVPGAAVREALAGQLWVKFPPWEDHVLVERARVLVVRFGPADAIRGTLPDAFERDLGRLVVLAREAGKRVLLVGTTRLQEGDARQQELDVRIRQVAVAHQVLFVDARAVRFDGAGDLVDGVHPTQAYSDRVSEAIAAALARLLQEVS